MDFGAGICNEGIRWRHIVIGGVIAELDQIIGSVWRLRMTAFPHEGGPIFVYQATYERGRTYQLAEHHPNYALSAVGKGLTRDTCHITITNNSTQGRT